MTQERDLLMLITHRCDTVLALLEEGCFGLGGFGGKIASEA